MVELNMKYSNMFQQPFSLLSLAHSETFSLKVMLLLFLFIYTFSRLYERWYFRVIDKKRNLYQLPVVPYTIPFVGSAFDFKKNFLEFMKNSSASLETGMFKTYMFGRYLIMVTDQEAAEIVMSKYQLSWKDVKHMLVNKGMGLSTPISKPLVWAEKPEKVVKKHVGNAASLETIIQHCQNIIQQEILPSINKEKNDNSGWKTLQILRFFGHGLVSFSANAIFNLPDLASNDMLDNILKFDSKFMQFVRKPSFLSKILFKEEYEAREKIIDSIKNAISNPDVDIENNKLWLDLFKLLSDMDLNLSDASCLDSRARMLLMQVFASILNTLPSTFWVIYQLLSHQDAYKAIREEVETIHRKRKEKMVLNTEDTTFFFELSDIQQMHKLDSLIQETFRLKTTARSMRSRVSSEDFIMSIPIDGTIKQIQVKKGDRFITCPSINHQDEEIFENAKVFKWDRFVPFEDGSLPKFFKNGREIKKPVNPFGGGKSYCPGRKFAVDGMKVLIAWMLLEYDLRFKDDLVPIEEPKLRSPIQSSNGMPACDVLIEVRKRTSCN